MACRCHYKKTSLQAKHLQCGWHPFECNIPVVHDCPITSRTRQTIQLKYGNRTNSPLPKKDSTHTSCLDDDDSSPPVGPVSPARSIPFPSDSPLLWLAVGYSGSDVDPLFLSKGCCATVGSEGEAKVSVGSVDACSSSSSTVPDRCCGDRNAGGVNPAPDIMLLCCTMASTVSPKSSWQENGRVEDR